MRVGGRPSWVQVPEVVTCGGCRGVMHFVAQTPGPLHGAWFYDDLSMLYAFYCDACGVIATTVHR